MSWKKFLREVIKACRKKKVRYRELKKWIYESFPEVEKKANAFHVFIGPTPRFKDLLLEVHILADNILYEFSVYEKKKQHFLYNTKKIEFIEESHSDHYIEFSFWSGNQELFVIEVREKEVKELRDFVRILTKTAWR